MTLNFDPVTLTVFLWPWTFVVCRLCRSETLSEIGQSAAELLQFVLWLWPWTLNKSSTMLCDSLHKVKSQSSYLLIKFDDFITLICYVTLWPWPLTRWLWKFVVDMVARGHSLYQIWSKSINSRLSYSQFGKFLLASRLAMTLSFDTLTLNFCGRSGVMCSNST